MSLRGLALWGVAMSISSSAGWADDSIYYAPNGIALSGYDVVAYFTEKRPVAGRAENAIKWRGAVWYFESPESQESFEMNPQAYAPQFGGYCVYAMSQGRRNSPAPTAFFFLDGRLYFMHTDRRLQQYEDHLPWLRSIAETKWPTVLDSPAGARGQLDEVAGATAAPAP